MAVTHKFQSAKSDGGDATLVQPSDWNDDHNGNPLPDVIVAASDSSAAMQDGADHVCDGTADDVQIQAAIDSLSTTGGVVLLAPGTYVLAATPTVSVNKRVHIIGYGAVLNLAASTGALKVQQGISTARGVRLEGVRINGQSNASTVGVELEDTNNSELVGVEIGGCATAILLESNAASNFVEGTLIDNCLLRDNTVGVKFALVSGTGSFMQTIIRGLKCVVGTGGTGMDIDNGCVLLRSHIQASFWIDSSETAVDIDGNMEDATLELAIEGAGGSTGNVGLTIGSNATSLDQAFIHLLFTGTIATQISNTSSKAFHYWAGGSQIVQTAGTAVLGYKRHGDAGDKIRLEGLTAGGKISFGSGSALDVEIHRSAADILASSDKFDPEDLSLPTKAGVPVDGDVIGAAADGDVIVDTTGEAVYVRIGGVWIPVTTQVFSRGGTILNSAGITTDNVAVWRAPFACTVTAVKGYRVGGTGATVNARKNGSSNHLSSAVSLSSASTWTDGGAVQNATYAAGDSLEIMVVSVTGTVTQIAIQVDFERT